MKNSRRFTTATVLTATVIMTVAMPGRRGSAQPSASGEWRTYGGDKGFTRYSGLDQINRENVKNLRPVWRRPELARDRSPTFRPTPTACCMRPTVSA